MKLAIADPPYPPRRSLRRDRPAGPLRMTTRSRAQRWYGEGVRASGDRRADFHAAAAEWDAPARHRALLEQLDAEYDGWAIATAVDGLEVYGPLPINSRVMAWVKPNAIPGGHRLRSMWEPVIVFPPEGRWNRRGGQVFDVLEARVPTVGFAGAKPEAWTHWVLSALGYDPCVDTVDDLFPGSGAVSRAIETFTIPSSRAVPSCWPWTGGLTRNGYGVFYLAGSKTVAHRAAYRDAVGEIPAGLQLDHLCRNRRCCNPRHLEPVTALVNVRRSPTHNAAKTHCPSGHPYDEANTRLYRGNRYCRACDRSKNSGRHRRPAAVS